MLLSRALQGQPLHPASPQCLSYTGVWQSGDASCSLLAEQKAHVIAYTTGSTHNHRIAAWILLLVIPLVFDFFLSNPSLYSSLFSSLISLPLTMQAFHGFPCHFTFPLLSGFPFLDFLLWPCPFPIPNHLFHILLCLPLTHKALDISHLLCLTLSTVQKTCWT